MFDNCYKILVKITRTRQATEILSFTYKWVIELQVNY